MMNKLYICYYLQNPNVLQDRTCSLRLKGMRGNLFHTCRIIEAFKQHTRNSAPINGDCPWDPSERNVCPYFKEKIIF